jgi:hypothetical protein
MILPSYYDSVGNRTQFSRTVGGVTTTRFYGSGGSNNLHFGVQIGGVNERLLNYDASGNQISDDRGAAGNFTYTINRSGRLAGAAKGGVSQSTSTYDAFERLRVRVVANQTPSTNNGTTHYIWDIFGNIIGEANGATGATLREMIYLGSMPLAAIDGRTRSGAHRSGKNLARIGRRPDQSRKVGEKHAQPVWRD